MNSDLKYHLGNIGSGDRNSEDAVPTPTSSKGQMSAISQQKSILLEAPRTKRALDPIKERNGYMSVPR